MSLHQSLTNRGSCSIQPVNREIKEEEKSLIRPIEQHIHIDQKKGDVEVKEVEEMKTWRSFCFEVNPHAVAYIGQYTITMSVLGLCAYMLLNSDGDCNRSSPWIGLISFILGKILSSVISSA